MGANQTIIDARQDSTGRWVTTGTTVEGEIAAYHRRAASSVFYVSDLKEVGNFDQALHNEYDAMASYECDQ